MAPARPAMAPAGGMGMMNKGGMAKMAAGGMPMKDGKPAFIGDGKGKMAKGGMAASSMGKVKTAAPSRDGVAVKGKTRAMRSGGKTC